MGFFPASPLKKVLLIVILLVAVFLRFYNLEESLQFQGDQGRDSMIVADIFRENNLVFIGPVTSVGNMYLGPLYYYFMMPFLWLTYPSPMGPVYAVAGLGVITVYLVYFLGKKLIGEDGALIATFFYTFSSVITQATRFSWNPNPAPLISLLMIYSSYIAWKKNPRYWIWVGVCFSILIQLHYLTLLSLPASGIIWLLAFKENFKNSKNKNINSKKITCTKKIKLFWKNFSKLLIPTGIALSIFLVSLTPLVLFDLKHQGNNSKAFQGLVKSEDNFKYIPKTSFIERTTKTIKENEGRGMHILFEIMIGKNRPLNKTLLYSALFFAIGFAIFNKYRKKDISPLIVIWIYLGIGVLGTSLYEHTIFNHYIAYLFPITALIYGWLFSNIKPRFISFLAFVGFTAYFLQYNIPNMPLKSLGWTINDIQNTSNEILKHVSPGEKYNIVLLSESRDIDGQNYRYYLTTGHTPPVKIEDRDSVETLFIINEEKKLSKVTDSPIYEIVVFPDKTPVEVFTIPGGPEITVLKRTIQPADQALE